jgi:uncharacterized protein
MGKKVVHVEFPAQDIERAKTFWQGVGGWGINDSGMPGMQYLMWQQDDQGGGIYSMEGETGTRVYLGTEDIDGDLAKVKELGGQTEDKMPIPKVGWFARCKDSEGNDFSLFQGDDNAPMPEGMGG